MSDRPTSANGKRSRTWGTTTLCPACGQCLCFGCHPHGPCLDEHDAKDRLVFHAGPYPPPEAWNHERGIRLNPGAHFS